MSGRTIHLLSAGHNRMQQEKQSVALSSMSARMQIRVCEKAYV